MFCTDEYIPFHLLHTPLPECMCAERKEEREGGREGGRDGGREGGRKGGRRKGGREIIYAMVLDLADSNPKNTKH